MSSTTTGVVDDGDSPGLHPARLLRLVCRSVADCRLDLDGVTVLTEAATGAYVVTPVIAAVAGAARVIAVTRDTRYGSVDEVAVRTHALATLAGVAPRIEIVGGKTAELFGAADVVTNSGHVRPLDAPTIAWMRPDAVVPLMFEAWELDANRLDLDLDALRARGIEVAGTNERHPEIDVFSFLGPMAIKQLTDAGIAVRGCRILVVCDNPFAPFLVRGLEAAGAEVEFAGGLDDRLADELDAIVVALRPRREPVLTEAHASRIGAEG